VNPLVNAGDHHSRGRRHHRSDLAPVVDDHQPLLDQDAWTRLELNDGGAVGVRLICAETL
jgi:hypothetical protein